MRGYHAYQVAVVGEELACQLVSASDRYAVAVIEGGVIIGHLPRKIPKVCSLFLTRGGSIS